MQICQPVACGRTPSCARPQPALSSHRPVDLNTQDLCESARTTLAGVGYWAGVAGLVEEAGNEAVPERSGREHHVPRLDVGV
jgi:hypothetical protein